MKRHAALNRCYRLIWSELLNTWVAVAETARGRGKAASRKRLHRMAAVSTMAASGLLLSAAIAAPVGGEVVSGSASISQSATTTNIVQTTPNATLNWQGFNIAPTEVVNFIQPSASAIAVNRIMDSNGTQILGQLNANGQVYLINPNGILFGAGSQVNVGGLVASTLDFNDASLSSNSRSFSGSGTGSIINHGHLHAADGGYIALLGNSVSNQGVITAQLGTVALGGGSATRLTFSGNQLLHLQVEQSTLNNLVENRQLIMADGGRVFMSAGASQSLLASVVNNTGVVEAHTVENIGGVIRLAGRLAINTGTLATNGSRGGEINISGHNLLQAGSVSADGSSGAGGTVTLNAEQRIIQTAPGHISSDGSSGGRIQVMAGQDANGGAFISGQLSAQGLSSAGGDILVSGSDLTLAAAEINARGASQGGQIRIGGDAHGQFILDATGLTQANARNTYINSSSRLMADATQQGDGGRVIVWADQANTFGGNISAQGAGGGQGGWVEVSGHDLHFAGDVQAKTLLLDPQNITISTAGSLPAYQLIDPNPSDSNNFGSRITALSSGNVVVTSSNDDFGASNAGAVYLFNGNSGALLSTLVGSSASDAVGNGVMALTNGNYVVSSAFWNNGAATFAGAVTWGNGITGVSGVVSAANSLVGSTASDLVGLSGVTALTNGNYVVKSQNWDNGAVMDAGAVTLGNGTTGVSGAVSAVNSLVGSTASDNVGSNVTALTNGNYVVVSQNWDNGAVVNAGAVTWGNGTTGVSGAVSAVNSLVGSTASDFVGSSGVTALTNGNYVVSSSVWDNGAAGNAGAVTWGNGTTGVSGAVSVANSLVGTKNNDGTSQAVIALSNGNYVVTNPNWSNGGISSIGAATWGNGLGGTIGPVTATNSLVGSRAGDTVGSSGAKALTNGNYVVGSPSWDNGTSVDAGAVTWGSGLGGLVGAVSVGNSLVGTTTNDQLSSFGVAALTNGNYVVRSPSWNNGVATSAGAATWGNGLGGTVGAVSAGNSLVGTTANDGVGQTVIALTNGNYVVNNFVWDNGAVVNVGAVTWGNGTTGVSGVVSDTNSLIGSKASDAVGSDGVSPTVTALSNGDYVVSSSVWDNGAVVDAGATTLGNGTTGVSSAVSAANSLLGLTSNDYSASVISVLPAGSDLIAVASSTYDNGGLDRGRVDVISTTGSMSYAMGQSQSVTVHPGALTNVLNRGTAVVLQASNDITLNNALIANNPSGNGGALTLQAGRSVLLNANITTDNGNLSIIANDSVANGVVNALRIGGNAAITMANGTLIDAGSGDVSLLLANSTDKTNNGGGDISIASVSASKITAVNQALSGNIVLQSGASLNAASSNTALTLAAANGGNFINLAGATPFSTPGGRWLVYSTTPASDSLGGLSLPNKRYAVSYASAAPWGATDSGILYSVAPTLTVTGDALSKVYREVNPALTYTLSGLIGGDTLATTLSGNLATTATTTSAVGSYAITQGTLAENLGYTLAYVPGSLAITPAPLAISGISAGNKVYDGNAVASLSGTASVIALGGDVVTIGGTGSGLFNDANVGVNKAVTVSGYSLGGAAAGNYNLLQPTGLTANISKADLGITGISASDKVYDGNAIASVSGIASVSALGSDVLTIAGTGSGLFDNANVGLGKAVTVSGYTLGGAAAGNYNLLQPAGLTANITAKALTATLSAPGKTYDGTTSATPTFSLLSGLVGSETVLATGVATFNTKDVATANLVTVDSTSLADGTNGGFASNYSLSSGQTVAANITAKALTATLSAPGKTYDGTTSATPTFSLLSGLVGSETVLATGVATFNSKDVAWANLVTVNSTSLANGANGGLATNYSLSSGQTVAASITAKALNINGISASNKVYDGNALASLSGTASVSALGSDVLTINGTGSGLFDNANVGLGKAVTVSGYTLGGSAASNYNLLQPAGLTANISAIPSSPVAPPSTPPGQVDMQSEAANARLNNTNVRAEPLRLSSSITVIRDVDAAAPNADKPAISVFSRGVMQSLQQPVMSTATEPTLLIVNNEAMATNPLLKVSVQKHE